ncbi:MAG: hypothetical protein EHM28_11955, partial [Spirochaetaceae bacterium]
MLHWSEHKEAAGGVWQMKLVFDLYRSLGPSRVQLFLHVIVIFFFLFSPAARRISRAFLEAVSASKGQGRVRSRQVYRHFYCFSYALLEKLSAWTRDIQVKDLVRKGPDLEILVKQLEERHGAV